MDLRRGPRSRDGAPTASPSPDTPSDTGPRTLGERLQRPGVWAGLLAAAAVLGVLAAAGPGLALLALAGLGTLGAIVWFQRFDLLLHLLVLSVFVESVGVGPVRVGRVLAATAVAVLVARAVFTRWQPRLARPPGAVLPVALFAVWAWASGLWATDTGAWAYAMGQLALALSYFLAFALVVERREQVHELLRTMVLGAVFAAGVAFVQVAAGAPRAEGLQGDPNIYALYQVASLPAAALLATTGPARRRWLGWAAIPVLLASVVATQSRGGLATALAVLVVMVARGDVGERLRRHRVATVTTAVMAGAGAVATVMTLNERFRPERVLNDRASGRLDIWYVAFREWQDHVLLGIGGGGFKPRSVELLLTEPGVQLVKSHLLLSSGIEVHNIYLETLVEYGAIGFLLFATVLLSTAWHLQRAAGTGDPALRALPMVLLAFLAASFFLSVVNNKLLWILIGLGVVVAGRTPLTDPASRPAPRPAARPLRGVPRPLAALCLAVLVVPAAVAMTATSLVPERYSSSVDFVVSTSAGPRDREATVRTLQSLATSRVVAADVVDRVGLDLAPEELAERIDVHRPPGSLLFTVSFDDSDRELTRSVVATLTQTYTERVAALQASSSAGEGRRFALRVWGSGTLMTQALPPPLLRSGVLGLLLGAASVVLLLGVWRRRAARVVARRRTPRDGGLLPLPG